MMTCRTWLQRIRTDVLRSGSSNRSYSNSCRRNQTIGQFWSRWFFLFEDVDVIGYFKAKFWKLWGESRKFELSKNSLQLFVFVNWITVESCFSKFRISVFVMLLYHNSTEISARTVPNWRNFLAGSSSNATTTRSSTLVASSNGRSTRTTPTCHCSTAS